MAYDGFAIDEYPDAEKIVAELDALKDGPIYGVKPEALAEYEEEDFAKKCGRSFRAACSTIWPSTIHSRW